MLPQLEYAQKRMQQKWYELVMAEQRGAGTSLLERLYTAYILAAEEYNRCERDAQMSATRPLQEGKRKKLAS